MKPIRKITSIDDVKNLLLDLGYKPYGKAYIRPLQAGHHIVEPKLYKRVPSIIYELVLVSPLWEDVDKEALRQLFAAWKQFKDKVGKATEKELPEIIKKIEKPKKLRKSRKQFIF